MSSINQDISEFENDMKNIGIIILRNEDPKVNNIFNIYIYI